MKRKLTIKAELFYNERGARRPGPNPNMTGYCSGLWGDCSGLWGDCSKICGNLDECDLTDGDRQRGVHIKDLIE